jgi:hypothetical protein
MHHYKVGMLANPDDELFQGSHGANVNPDAVRAACRLFNVPESIHVSLNVLLDGKQLLIDQWR